MWLTIQECILIKKIIMGKYVKVIKLINKIYTGYKAESRFRNKRMLVTDNRNEI